MMATAVASSNTKHKYENHCGRYWNLPFVTTVIRLDIDFIETSFFNGNKLSLGIQRQEKEGQTSASFLDFLKPFLSAVNPGSRPRNKTCELEWNSQKREPRKSRFEVYCGMFNIIADGNKKYHPGNFLTFDCETQYLRITRLALAVFLMMFGNKVSKHSSTSMLLFRVLSLLLWMALNFLINRDDADPELVQSRNLLWNTASVTAFAYGLAGLFTGGTVTAIERSSYSIVQTVTIILIAKVSSVEGGWDYHSQSGFALFSATGLAQLLLCFKLLLGSWFCVCCGDTCCGDTCCEDICDFFFIDDEEKEDPAYRAHVDATTHLHLQQMREDLLQNMSSEEYENYISKLSPAGLKSLEHFLTSGQQCTPQQLEDHKKQKIVSCWTHDLCFVVVVLAFSAALFLTFFDKLPFDLY